MTSVGNSKIALLTGEVSVDVQVLSKVTNKQKYRLREFIDGKTKLLISHNQLETIVNNIVQSKIDDFIHQLDSRNITLAELLRMNKRL
jgi:hypothetical protein